MARNNSIDILRGVAILIMISANSWSSVYPLSEQTPLWLRIVFSTAAPIFIFLSGVSVFMSLQAGKTPTYLFKRALQVLLIGVFIDVAVWNIYPFVTFDVLYVISLSIFLLVLLHKAHKAILAIFALILLLGNTFFLQYYHFELPDYPLNGTFPPYVQDAPRRLLLDGWFPVFPWAGIAFLGFLATKYQDFLKQHKTLILGVGLLALASYVFLLSFTNQVSIAPLREDYAEIFYPVQSYFWLYLVSILLIGVFLIHTPVTGFEFVANLGKTSLTIYLFHTFVISFFLPLFAQEAQDFDIWLMIGGMATFYALMIVLNLLLVKYKRTLQKGKYRLVGTLIGF